MASAPYRSTVGPKFSEGSRRLWLAAEGLGSQAALEAAFNTRFPEDPIDAGVLSRYLYGERRADRRRAMQLREVFGIDPTAWDQSPAAPFTPPGARKDSDPPPPADEPSGEHPLPAADPGAEVA
jgi:hypothetical protein